MRSSAHFLADILAQPSALRAALERYVGATPERDALDEAARLLARAPNIDIAGIGASYGACVPLFVAASARGAATLWDASEMLYGRPVPAPDAAAVIVSRSGESIEIVALAEKLKAGGTPFVAITNAPASPLGRLAAVTLPMAVDRDHLISVKTCTAAALVGSLLGHALNGGCVEEAAPFLDKALSDSERAFIDWRERLDAARAFFSSPSHYYHLARGADFGAALAARLLWEEAGKSPATAANTSSFRHGTAEIISPETRLLVWIDPRILRDGDLSTAAEARRNGAQVALIGQRLPEDGGDIVLSLPTVAPAFRAVISAFPAQCAAYAFTLARGIDADHFRFSPYIVKSEQGLGADVG